MTAVKTAPNGRPDPRNLALLSMAAGCLYKLARELFDDAMIAATARVHDLTVVTRNVRDFRNFGVDLVNPFASP